MYGDAFFSFVLLCLFGLFVTNQMLLLITFFN